MAEVDDKILYGIGYDNLDDAAMAASLALEQQPGMNTREYVTALAKGKDGKFYRSRFDTSDQAGQAPVGGLLGDLYNAGYTPEAVLHNHPGGPLAKFDPALLSEADSKLGDGGQKLGDRTLDKIRMYLLAKGSLGEGHGNYKKAKIPGVSGGGLNSGVRFQTTEPTLAQYPIEELKMRIAKRIQLDMRMDPNMKTQLLKSLLVPSQSTLASQ